MTKTKGTNLSKSDQLINLVKLTTIKWVWKCSLVNLCDGIIHETNGVLVAGNDSDSNINWTKQKEPINFHVSVEPHWKRVFDSFGTVWTIERQKFRLLYDSYRTFFSSFNGLRQSKTALTIPNLDLTAKTKQADFAGCFLIQMYVSGKRSLDLMKALKIFEPNSNAKKFINSRNALFEHNHNPNNFRGMILEPSFWNLIDTTTFLPVNIHTQTESQYIGYIDYYQDYFDLEDYLIGVIASVKL